MYQPTNLAIEDRAISMPARDGETLIVKGDPCEHTLEIRSGIVRAVTYSREGDRQIMAFFFPGELLGLPLASTHRYSAEAITGVRYVRYSPQRFRASFAIHEFASEFVSRAIWHEEEAFITRGLILGRVGVQARIAAFLRYLASRLPRTCGMLEFTIPQGDVASYLATSPETVCRTLRRMRDERIIAMPRKDRLQILDDHRLDFLAEAGMNRAH